MSIEREEQALEDALRKGEISNTEYNLEMLELQRGYRAYTEEAAQQAYEDEIGRW